MPAKVLKLGSNAALVKQIKTAIERADSADARANKATAEADRHRHEAGLKLIELKERCEHGEWLPYLETIGITSQRASELMAAGRDEAAPERERERQREKRANTAKAAKANPRSATGNLETDVERDRETCIGLAQKVTDAEQELEKVCKTEQDSKQASIKEGDDDQPTRLH
jgi:hypothetical protein